MNRNQSPLVSVIVPCYNQGVYLDDAVDSVLAQTYANLEIIIVNDGSTDAFTNQLLGNYRRPKCKVVRTENQGLAAARNEGIRRSAGKYVLPLDADDRIAPEYIAEAVAILERRDAVTLVYCEAEFFGARQQKWELPPFSFFRLLYENLIFCSAVYRRSAYDLTDGYDPTMRHGWEDWELWIAMLRTGGEVVRIPAVRFYYRIKEDSMATSLAGNLARMQALRTYIFRKHYDTYLAHGAFVSVVISNYNQAAYLPKRIESILQQTFPFLELIILDDGSTDGSRAVIGQYAGQDDRIRVLLNERHSGSLLGQWDKGVQAAKGAFVWIADAHDVAHEALLNRLLAPLVADAGLGLSYCQSWRVDAGGAVAGACTEAQTAFGESRHWEADYLSKGPVEVMNYLVYRNTIPCPGAVLFRRSVYLQAGMAEAGLPQGGDWYLWLRMLLAAGVAYAAEPLNYCRHEAPETCAERRTPALAAELHVRKKFQGHLLRKVSRATPLFLHIYALNKMLRRASREELGYLYIRQGHVFRGFRNLLPGAFYPKLSLHTIKVGAHHLKKGLKAVPGGKA